MKTTARSIIRVIPIFVLTLLMTLVFQGQRVEAGVSDIYNYPESKTLSSGYKFRSEETDSGVRAYIYTDSGTVAELKLKSEGPIYFQYAAKINGKYYFNARYGDGAGNIGLFTYKPGDNKFVKEKSQLLIDSKCHIGKYWAAYWNYLPSDTSPKQICLYDVKSKKRISLGSNVDAIRQIGKKFYYCKFSKNGEKVKVFRCKANGKSKKTLATRKLKNKKGTPSWERSRFWNVQTMTSHAVKVFYVKANGMGGVMKIKYR